MKPGGWNLKTDGERCHPPTYWGGVGWNRWSQTSLPRRPLTSDTWLCWPLILFVLVAGEQRDLRGHLRAPIYWSCRGQRLCPEPPPSPVPIALHSQGSQSPPSCWAYGSVPECPHPLRACQEGQLPSEDQPAQPFLGFPAAILWPPAPPLLPQGQAGLGPRCSTARWLWTGMGIQLPRGLPPLRRG